MSIDYTKPANQNLTLAQEWDQALAEGAKLTAQERERRNNATRARMYKEALDTLSPAEIVAKLDIDRERIQNRLLDALETHEEECQLLQDQFHDIHQIIESLMAGSKEKYDELCMKLIENKGIRLGEINDPEEKIIPFSR